MHPSTEAPPRTQPTGSDGPLLQQRFGHAEPDRHDDHDRIGDTVDGPTADPAAPEDQPDAGEQTADQLASDDERRDEAAGHDEQQPDAVADDVPHGERRLDGLGDLDRDDYIGPTPDDTEPAATVEPSYHDLAAEAPADDESSVGPRTGEPTGRDEPTDRKPGDGPVTSVAAVWAGGSVQDLRDRWREAQLRFVDDPRKAADDTRNLVDEAVEALTAALASHREQLNSLPTNGDTEQYRVFVQRCRTFFERLLTL